VLALPPEQFDVQRLRVRFIIENAYLFTCDNMSAMYPMFPLNETRRAEEVLLPVTEHWGLAGRPEQTVTLDNPKINGVTDYSRCDLQIIIAHSYVVYFLKGLMITILCVFVSLITAAYLHPQDQIGDRFTVLFLAFIILVFNFSVDLGLGTVSQVP
jgi:hypothetical protein